MAICYQCGEQFYGHYCPYCSKKAIYTCFNCKTKIDPEETTLCKKCGWYECPECDACGCWEDRPLSKEEKANE